MLPYTVDGVDRVPAQASTSSKAGAGAGAEAIAEAKPTSGAEAGVEAGAGAGAGASADAGADASEAGAGASAEGVENANVPKELRYTLSGVVVHQGMASAGHYYSFVRIRSTPETRANGTAGKWFKFNDEEVC